MSSNGGQALPPLRIEYFKPPREPGISLRNYFAAAAMTGLCANPDLSRYAERCGFSPENVRNDFTCTAFQIADLMLKAGKP